MSINVTDQNVTIVLACMAGMLLILTAMLFPVAAYVRKSERIRCYLLAKETKRAFDREYPEDALDRLAEQIVSGKPDLSGALELELNRLPGQG